MEKNGLINKLVFDIGATHAKLEAVSINKVVKEKEASFTDVYSTLKKVGDTKDILNIITSEKIIILMESDFYTDNKDFSQSMKVAKEDIDKSLVCLSLHKNIKAYLQSSAAIPKVKNGLPYDTFRQFIDSNKARLNNRGRTAELSSEEKKVISARIRNMGIADKEYQKLQVKSLGMDIKGKDKGLER